MDKNNKPRIVIVGGGAGGLELATKLGKKLGKKNGAEITLVDCSPTHIWKPILHEVAAGTLNSNEDELNYFAYASDHYFQFCLGTLAGLDRTEKNIFLSPLIIDQQEILPKRSIPYDILILAIGSITNDFGVPGAREHCLFLDNEIEAEGMRARLISNMLRLSYEKTQNREDKFSIVIVGGGATGIELAAELKYAISQMHQSGLELDPAIMKITIVEAAKRLLPVLPQRISDNVAKKLQRLDINVLTDARITAVNSQGVIVKDKLIAANMIVWAAGVKADDVLRQLDGLETNAVNQLVVNQTLQTTKDEAIFAFGDCASCPQAGTAEKVPPRAQAAHQQASLLVTTMENILKNKPLPVYDYQDYGSLISLSKFQTFGSLMGGFAKNIFIAGAVAHIMYRSLYKMHQVALYGFWRVMLLSVANFLSRSTRARFKVH